MIDIKIDDREVNRLLTELQKKAKDLSPVMDEIGEIIISSVEENFEQEGRYSSPDSWRGGSKKWEKLAVSTEAQKKKRGYSGKILQQTGQLAGNVSKMVTDKSVKVGVNKEYGAAMHYGFDDDVKVSAHRRKVKSRNIGSGRKKTASGVGFVKAHKRKMKIPARPFLVVQDEDMQEIKDALMDYLKK